MTVLRRLVRWRERLDTVRGHLLVLVLAVGVPLTLFAVATVGFVLRLERRAAEQRVVDAARTVALALDREFATAETALRVLATSRTLPRGDLLGFREQALIARTSEEAWIILFDRQGLQLVNTLLPPSAPLGRRANPTGVEAIFATRQPSVSNLYVGGVVTRYVAAVDVPVMWDDRVQYVLTQALFPEYFARVLWEYPWPQDWVVSIFDGNGVTVTRSHHAEGSAGQPAGPELLEAARRMPEGAVEHRSADGIPVYDAFSRSRRSEWVVAVTVPMAALNAPVIKALGVIAAGAALALAAAGMLAFLVGGAIAAPLKSTAASARALGRGEPLSAEPPGGPLEIRQISAALREAAEAIGARERAVAQLQAITDVALSHLAPAAFLDHLLARVREFLDADTAALLTMTADGRYLAVRATVGFPEGTGRGLLIPLGGGFAGRVAAERRPILASPVTGAEVGYSGLMDQGLRVLFGVPLMVEERLTGVLHVGWRTDHRVSESEIDLLTRIAGRSALGIERVNLFESLQDANRELERLLHAARMANTAKDEFLATVSHELRTPLNAMLGWLWLLRGGTLDPGMQQRALDTIERSARTQARLVEDLLDVSRIVARTLRIEQAPVSFTSVVTAAVDTVRPAADRKSIDVRVDVGPRELVVEGDRGRLEQVVLNLVSNAVKFTPAGGRVHVRAGQVEGHVELVVQDNGIGIAPDVLPHVFDHFRQADQTSTRRYGGLGLGLTIVKQLVELHHGTVRAHSAGLGHGATFVVRLPLVQADSEAGQPSGLAVRERPVLGGLDGVRILLVDDDEDNLVLLEHELRAAGADVVAATSAQRALEALDHESVTILISDISMPDQDGYELLAAVRARSWATGGPPPAIALTAYAQQHHRDRARAAGFAAHVAKPVDPDALVAIVRDVLRVAGEPRAS